MISVVIATFNDERRLTATLSALVPAAVDGLVRELLIADAGSSDATLEIADEAGALVVASGLGEAVARAKEPWLLVLDAGAELAPGWEPVVRDCLKQRPPMARWLVAPGAGVAALFGQSGPLAGLLAPKAMLAGGAADLASLARALGGRARKLKLALHREP